MTLTSLLKAVLWQEAQWALELVNFDFCACCHSTFVASCKKSNTVRDNRLRGLLACYFPISCRPLLSICVFCGFINQVNKCQESVLVGGTTYIRLGVFCAEVDLERERIFNGFMNNQQSDYNNRFSESNWSVYLYFSLTRCILPIVIV